MNPINKAIKICGGLSALALALDKTPQQVSNWRSRWPNSPVPIEYCVSIEKATNGQVTRKDLRPDDWQQIWPELVEKASA